MHLVQGIPEIQQKSNRVRMPYLVWTKQENQANQYELRWDDW